MKLQITENEGNLFILKTYCPGVTKVTLIGTVYEVVECDGSGICFTEQTRTANP